LELLPTSLSHPCTLYGFIRRYPGKPCSGHQKIVEVREWRDLVTAVGQIALQISEKSD